MSQLRLENICYQYKNAGRQALKEVSCVFRPGLCHSVVGPSGSGKTTLLSIMAGLDSPQSGTVSLDDKPLSEMDLDRYRREGVAIIFQAFQLFPLLTAVENVCYPMEIAGVSKREAKKRASELLKSVGIDEAKLKRYPSHLSGGEQQRVAIARALSTGARVILADEPTGNLDGENGRIVVDILKKLAHEQNYCVIIVTHNTEIAEESDRVFRMSDGVLSAS